MSDKSLELTTEPNTDLWQRTYYGFQNENAPALLLESQQDFSFTFQTHFDYKNRFDQCGVVIFLDQNHWFKGAIEYESAQFARLGSVVTNNGYSDWATQDISLISSIWYRLHRRGPDFLLEYSLDGEVFKQMRIFHIMPLGETTTHMGQSDTLNVENHRPVKFGLYACSPSESSFTAKFDNFLLTENQWQAHH